MIESTRVAERSSHAGIMHLSCVLSCSVLLFFTILLLPGRATLSTSFRLFSSESFYEGHISRHAIVPHPLRLHSLRSSLDISSPKKDLTSSVGVNHQSSLRKDGVMKNLKLRTITGLGLAVACPLWIGSGKKAVTIGGLALSLLAQYEYHSILQASGNTNPSWRVTAAATTMSFLAAAAAPQAHELVIPLSASILLLGLLLSSNRIPTISEITSNFYGLFYFGYLPSFWVRLYAMDWAGVSGSAGSSQQQIGGLLLMWTWACIAFADIAAYFFGVLLGKHKISLIWPAAGLASPNKSIEGAIAGLCGCLALSLSGAYAMEFPRWKTSGFLFGFSLFALGLIGDLTASMLKRDAKVKDSGTILPGHGGIIDRMDSYILTAPFAFLFFSRILQFLNG